MDAEILDDVILQLHRLIRNADESEAERNIRDAIAYLDCARANLTSPSGRVYRIRAQVVASSSQQ